MHTINAIACNYLKAKGMDRSDRKEWLKFSFIPVVQQVIHVFVPGKEL